MSKIATETKVVHDDALGIDRRVVAGTEIPPDLLEAYEQADGGTTDKAPAAPGVVIASEDKVVHDEVLGINRKVFAGQPVPVDLVDAYQDAGGEVTDQPPPSEVDYDKQPVEELRAEVERRGLDVEGTGADGKVVKADLVAALKADDEE